MKHSLISNLIFHLASARKWNKWVCYFQFLDVIPDMTATFLGIWLPSLIVTLLQNHVSLGTLMLRIVVIMLVILICNVCHACMYQYLYRNGLSLTLYYDRLSFQKSMKIEYDCLEKKETRELAGNIWNALRDEFVIRDSVTAMPTLLMSAVSSFLYGIMLCRVNLVLVAMLMVTIGLNVFLVGRVRKTYQKNHEELSKPTKTIAYINRHAMERSDGKDIRIYQMQNWFLQKYDEAIGNMDRLYGRIHDQFFFRRAKELGIEFVTELISYGYLAWLLLNGEQSIAEFVFCIGLVKTFSGNFSELIKKVQGLNRINAFLADIRTYLELPEAQEKPWKNTDRSIGTEITFREVSFRYPGTEEDILKNINLTISPNEKLALLGLNGAGKTTLVKLLCGFYKPTEGQILINGIEQSEYDKKEYLGLISALFQDSMLFPLTLDENLTTFVTEELEKAALVQTLKWSGFDTRYESLAQKGKTRLVREVYEDATDFSGGEKQKLLFARALYKKAPLLILDEPTAALDPIAENELYLRYREAARNRTTIFISHRLSSTRFCDRIVLLEDAAIIEEGTHDELMKKGGRYRELFEMQSKYYRQEGAL